MHSFCMNGDEWMMSFDKLILKRKEQKKIRSSSYLSINLFNINFVALFVFLVSFCLNRYIVRFRNISLVVI